MPVARGSTTPVTTSVQVPGNVDLAFTADSADDVTTVRVQYEITGGTGVRLLNGTAEGKNVGVTLTKVEHTVRLESNGQPLSPKIDIRGTVTEKGAFQFHCDWGVAVKGGAFKAAAAEGAVTLEGSTARPRRRRGEKSSHTKQWLRKRGPKHSGPKRSGSARPARRRGRS